MKSKLVRPLRYAVVTAAWCVLIAAAVAGLELYYAQGYKLLKMVGQDMVAMLGVYVAFALLSLLPWQRHPSIINIIRITFWLASGVFSFCRQVQLLANHWHGLSHFPILAIGLAFVMLFVITSHLFWLWLVGLFNFRVLRTTRNTEE